LIPGTSTNYSLTIRANEVATMMADGLRMQPGQIVTQKFTTTSLKPASGSDYIEFVLVNGNTAGYTLPTVS
jgi:hypothetical protein